MAKKVAIIGAGWYGCHLARVLSGQGFDVTLYEKNGEILNEISGNFGVRLHLGLHYPRSKQTRENCIKEYDEFLSTYPELVNHHEHSIYGLGKVDANGFPSKVSAEDFETLASEHSSFKIIDPEKIGYKNLHTAIDTTEASLVVGKKLRSKFNEYLAGTDVKIKLNTTVEAVTRGINGKTSVSTQSGCLEEFDAVINATSYHHFLPGRELPFNIEITYQVCAGLLYEDTQEKEKGKATPFIVMDGWFPCLMSYDDGELKENSQYIVIHGKWTILDTCSTEKEARRHLYNRMHNKELQDKVEQECRAHLSSFYPEFSERFKPVGWKLNVLAKLKTDKEFRSTVVFQDAKTDIIHIIPGKVGGVSSAGQEVLALLNSELNEDKIQSEEGYRYVVDGVLFKGKEEASEKPHDMSRNTSGLQTAREISESECVAVISSVMHTSDSGDALALKKNVLSRSSSSFFAVPSVPQENLFDVADTSHLLHRCPSDSPLNGLFSPRVSVH
jgi:hypothetical protein